MTIRTPAATASIAIKSDEDGKLFAPSAARNTTDVCAALKSIAPPSGRALEIASGTGQHIIAFANAMPDIHWLPTEVEPARLTSIRAYIDGVKATNIAAPITLDATQKGWAEDLAKMDLISLANLLHLISGHEAEVLIEQASRALTEDGKLFLYGPFKRDGKLISDGDAEFDASLRTADPDTGYKDDKWIKKIAKDHGLSLHQAIEMASNNLSLVFKKSKTPAP